MSKKKDNEPTDPIGWRERAAGKGWMRDPQKRLDMETFAETIAAVPAGRLRGVRVGPMQLEAWWTIDATVGGTGRDGQPTSLTFERTHATILHHVPKAESRQVERVQDERAWCPAHAFQCKPTFELPCGYDCRRTKLCDCPQCLQIIDKSISAEKRLGLVFYPQTGSKDSRIPMPPMHSKAKRANNKAVEPKKKRKKPIDHLLPGQIGLLAPTR